MLDLGKNLGSLLKSVLPSSVLPSNVSNQVQRQVRNKMSTVQRRLVNRVVSPPDKRAEQVINDCLTILQNPNETERLEQLQHVLHRSLLYTDKNTGQVTLQRSIKEFSYQKALRSFDLYQLPVKITEVQPGQRVTVGASGEAERGHTDKYFIAKNPGVEGPPAPILVFFPEDNSDPKIVNFGSL